MPIVTGRLIRSDAIKRSNYRGNLTS